MAVYNAVKEGEDTFAGLCQTARPAHHPLAIGDAAVPWHGRQQPAMDAMTCTWCSACGCRDSALDTGK